MKINGVDGLTVAQVQSDVAKGGRFVVFQYCISVIVMTFRRGSDIYFIKAGESAFGRGLGYSLLTLLLGWWGIPWGPIYTIGALVTNFGGGKDVTKEILVSLNLASAQTRT